jgi:hypothetical protein
MRHPLNRRLVMQLGLAAVLIGVLVIGCFPPVSDEATVRVEGRVVDVDGTAAVGVTVRLYKTPLNTLDADWVVGNIVNNDANVFMDTVTDGEGRYAFEFSGADANADNQAWAAYFMVYVIHPDDPGNQLAVASEEFHFTNQHLLETLPEMAFWDLEEDAVVVEEDSFTVTWPDSELAPENGEYRVIVGDGAWVGEVTGNALTLPLTVLEPCASPVTDPAECEPRNDHFVQVVSLADELRYRTAALHFTAENPKGLGIWFPRGAENNAATTCSGKNVFDVNDGHFSGENAVAKLVADEGLTVDDVRCIIVDLGAAHAVDEIWLHNGLIWNAQKAKVEVALGLEDPDTAADDAWTPLGTWEGADQLGWQAYLHLLPGGETGRYLRIRFVDAEEGTVWHQIGEISVYGDAVEIGD